MWTYDKKLEYPVNIKNPNAAMAKVIITQFGGPDCKKVCRLFLITTGNPKGFGPKRNKKAKLFSKTIAGQALAHTHRKRADFP